MLYAGAQLVCCFVRSIAVLSLLLENKTTILNAKKQNYKLLMFLTNFIGIFLNKSMDTYVRTLITRIL